MAALTTDCPFYDPFSIFASTGWSISSIFFHLLLNNLSVIIPEILNTKAIMKTAFVLSALAAIASAHFNLNYPAARGFDEDTLGNL